MEITGTGRRGGSRRAISFGGNGGNSVSVESGMASIVCGEVEGKCRLLNEGEGRRVSFDLEVVGGVEGVEWRC